MGKALCKWSFSELIIWKVTTKTPAQLHEKESEQGQKPLASCQRQYRFKWECGGTWNVKLITEGKLSPFWPFFFTPFFCPVSCFSLLPLLWLLAENTWGPLKGFWDFAHHQCNVHAKHLHLIDTLNLCYLSMTLSFEGLRIHKPSSVCWRATSLLIATSMTNLHPSPHLRYWNTCGIRR